MYDVGIPVLLRLRLFGHEYPGRLEVWEGEGRGDVDVAVVAVPGHHPLLQVPGTQGAMVSRVLQSRPMAFSWLKVPSSTFRFKTLLGHYAKRALTNLWEPSNGYYIYVCPD